MPARSRTAAATTAHACTAELPAALCGCASTSGLITLLEPASELLVPLLLAVPAALVLAVLAVVVLFGTAIEPATASPEAAACAGGGEKVRWEDGC